MKKIKDMNTTKFVKYPFGLNFKKQNGKVWNSVLEDWKKQFENLKNEKSWQFDSRKQNKFWSIEPFAFYDSLISKSCWRIKLELKSDEWFNQRKT